jgi:hypothetical protein
MVTSSRYRELKNEILQLRNDLLPKRFNRSGRYNRQDVTRTLAYRVLVHAQIEAYLEDRAWEIALAAVRAWKNENRTSKTILALIAFSGRVMEKPPNSVHPDQQGQLNEWDEKIKLSKKIDLAVNDFYHVVKQNHGIKEENIVRLLLPIGVDCDDLDTVLIADLNSYGESRGLAAHTAFQAYRTTEQIDPKEELIKVKTLVANLVSIDGLFDKMLEIDS